MLLSFINGLIEIGSRDFCLQPPQFLLDLGDKIAARTLCFAFRLAAPFGVLLLFAVHNSQVVPRAISQRLAPTRSFLGVATGVLTTVDCLSSLHQIFLLFSFSVLPAPHLCLRFPQPFRQLYNGVHR